MLPAGPRRPGTNSPGTARLTSANITAASTAARKAGDVVIALPQWSTSEYRAAFVSQQLAWRDQMFAAGDTVSTVVTMHATHRSGKAITIDGAFSEAYGDHGFTLVLEADRTLLVKHHHFESVEAAVRDGVDIIPEVSVIRTWDSPPKNRRHRTRQRTALPDRYAAAAD